MNLAVISWLLLSLLLPIGQNEGIPEGGLNLQVEAEPGTEEAQISLKLSNNGAETASLEFPTSQYYEVTIVDENGSEVYSLSKGRSYLQAIQTVSVEAGGTKEWKNEWAYAADGIRVPAGKYKAVAELKATNLNGKPFDTESLRSETEFQVPSQGGGAEAQPGAKTIFTGLKVSGSGGNYSVTGKARPRTGEFFYTVEDGHNQLVPETKISLGKKYPEWSEFEIDLKIAPKKLPQNATLMMNLYEKEGGTITGEPMALILQQFRGKE